MYNREFLVCEIVGSVLDVAIGQLRRIVVARHWEYRRAQRRHSDLKRRIPDLRDLSEDCVCGRYIVSDQDRVEYLERLEETRQERDRTRRRYRDIHTTAV